MKTFPKRYLWLVAAFGAAFMALAFAWPRADATMPEFDSERSQAAKPLNIPAGAAVATFAGGCFWGIEDGLRKVPGVLDARAGYSGGSTANPTYYNKGDHKEAVQVVFDPQQTSYESLLRTFFTIHDPTFGGGDRSYRSFLYTHSPEQAAQAKRVIAELNRTGAYKSAPKPIQTQVQPAETFYPAEEYHQRYYEKRGGMGSCPI
ncbi:MAG: hypothetical protein OHK0029_29980 [Armatimonadaceae bacterium]